MTLTADDDGDRPAEIGLARGQRCVGIRTDDPETPDVEVRERPARSSTGDEEQVLDGAGRRLDGCRRQGSLAVGGVRRPVRRRTLRPFAGACRRSEDPRASRGRGRAGARPRGRRRARMSSRPATSHGGRRGRCPGDRRSRTIAVSVPPSTSTTGIRRLVAWRTSFSSAIRRCGTTSRRRRLAAGDERLLDGTAARRRAPRPRRGGARRRPRRARNRTGPASDRVGGHRDPAAERGRRRRSTGTRRGVRLAGA